MAILVALIFVLPACGVTDKDRPLLVFAAASLENVVTELAERFEERTKVDVDIAFGGSNALAQQILSGAPADLFISAGLPPANLLTESGRADESDLYSIAGNELVIAAAPGRRSFDSAVDLLSGDVGRIALVDPAFAPAGWYTEQALRNAGVWQELLPKTLFAKDARAALAYVESGSVDAGIVYRTDAATEPTLAVAYTIPITLHSPIAYVGVSLRDSSNGEDAARLLEYFGSEDSRQVFSQYGFSSPPRIMLDTPEPIEPEGRESASLMSILLITLRVGVVATLLNLPLALTVSWLVVKKRIRGGFVLDVVASLPLAVPPVVVGYMLLLLLGNRGALGGFIEDTLGVEIVFTWFAAALAAAIVSFPLMARAIMVAMEEVDERLERSARILGAGPLRVAVTITLPLAYRGILAGVLLGFVRALSEFGATIVVAGSIPGRTQTLPLAIYQSVQIGDDRQALTLIAASITLAVITLAVHNRLSLRSRRQRL